MSQVTQSNFVLGFNTGFLASCFQWTKRRLFQHYSTQRLNSQLLGNQICFNQCFNSRQLLNINRNLKKAIRYNRQNLSIMTKTCLNIIPSSKIPTKVCYKNKNTFEFPQTQKITSTPTLRRFNLVEMMKAFLTLATVFFILKFYNSAFHCHSISHLKMISLCYTRKTQVFIYWQCLLFYFKFI